MEANRIEASLGGDSNSVHDSMTDPDKTESAFDEHSTEQPVNILNLDTSQINLSVSNILNFQRRKQFHEAFLLLKKQLNLEKFMRKTQIDSLLKKCKSKVCKTIHEALNKCLKIKLHRLPQKFITNIKIDFNKKYLEKSILEIYQEHGLIYSLEDFKDKGYIVEQKENLFRDFLNFKLSNVFHYYISSKQYANDYYHIQRREGEKFAILFNYTAKIFVQYYAKSKGNQKKKYPENKGKRSERNKSNTTFQVMTQVENKHPLSSSCTSNPNPTFDSNPVTICSKVSGNGNTPALTKTKIFGKRFSFKKSKLYKCNTVNMQQIFEIKKITKEYTEA